MEFKYQKFALLNLRFSCDPCSTFYFPNSVTLNPWRIKSSSPKFLSNHHEHNGSTCFPSASPWKPLSEPVAHVISPSETIPKEKSALLLGLHLVLMNCWTSLPCQSPGTGGTLTASTMPALLVTSTSLNTAAHAGLTAAPAQLQVGSTFVVCIS